MTEDSRVEPGQPPRDELPRPVVERRRFRGFRRIVSPGSAPAGHDLSWPGKTGC